MVGNSKVLDKLESDIEKYGWHVLSVFGDDLPNFAYSIGFTETLNHPEIVISGLNTDLMHELLNDIGNLIKQGYKFTDGDICNEVIKGYPVKFLAVNKLNVNEYFNAANAHYGEGQFDTLQCVWPDQNGDFPLITDETQEVLS
nr:DUF4262 domain-containing protein [Pseudoalteromonas arctica]